MPKKAHSKKAFPIRARGGRAMATGGETGAKIGEYFGNMLEEEFNKVKGNIGLARGGMYPAAGVGSDVGQKIEDWIVNWWNSLARGGKAPPKMTPALRKKAMAAMKAQGIMPAAGVGADVGQKIEDWITNWWNSLFARGGVAMARGGMARGGLSVFH